MGLAFRTVEVFVLSADSTRTLHGWFGGAAAAPGASLERLALQSDAVARRELRPPTWLGYALLSAGAVMLVNGIMQAIGKRLWQKGDGVLSRDYSSAAGR
jgi:hypothetical protein